MAIPLNDNIATRSNKPSDSRVMDFAGGLSVPFASVAAALSAINSAYRCLYLTIWAKASNGDPLEYWWKNDLTDGSLEPKNKESITLNGDSSLTLLPGYNYQDIIVVPTSTLTNLKIGTTNGGGELEPGTAVTAGATYKLAGSLGYITSSTSLFFAGILTGTKILIYKKF